MTPFLSHPQRARVLLIASCVACLVLCFEGGKVFAIPLCPHCDMSLLLGDSPLSSLLVVWMLLLVGVGLGTLIAGSIRPDAGLFAATTGLAALSVRGGSVGDVLRQASGNMRNATPFLCLGLELLLLGLMIALAWAALRWLVRSGRLKDDSARDGLPSDDNSLGQRFCALATQILVTAAIVMFLCVTDAKQQALASIFIASFIGAVAAHSFFAAEPSIWCWAGPLMVGLIGYVWAYASPGNWQIGKVAVPLARALPLDWASAGPAGAILGYWMSRRWQRATHEEEEGTAEDEVTE
jgi:hypothetical protein